MVIYIISVSDASLAARQRVLEQVQERFARGAFGPAKDVKLRSMQDVVVADGGRIAVKRGGWGRMEGNR